MPLVPSSTPLTHFRLISFDVYGTLVDWETGIASALLASPHLSSLPSSHPFKTSRKALLKAFETHERAIQAAHPNMLYSAVPGESYKQLVASLSTSTRPPTTTPRRQKTTTPYSQQQQQPSARAPHRSQPSQTRSQRCTPSPRTARSSR